MINQILSTSLLLSCCLALAVNSQFLPQSHLGRLVQSITSPLVIGGGSGGSDSYPDSSPYSPSSSSSSGSSPYSAGGPLSSSEYDGQSQIQAQGRPTSHYQYNDVASSSLTPRQKHHYNQHLQQAPTQHYYNRNNQHNSNSNNDDDGDYPNVRDQVGSAPSNNKGVPHQEYQMGAYLGPTIDDKEINGAFNSNNDHDEDDGPSSYDGPSSSPMSGGGGGGGRQRGASNSYNNYDGGSGYDRQPTNLRAGNSSPYNDDDGADEADNDGASSPIRGRHNSNYGRGGLNQAASRQYNQQQGNNYGYGPAGINDGPPGNGMMAAAAAGGYGGGNQYGAFNGPVDITGLMGAAAGNGGYEAYNGDGSYPGANYYQQQQQARGRNQQQEASNNNNSGRQANDNDNYGDNDNDADED